MSVYPLEFLLELLELFVRQIFQVNEGIARGLNRPDQLIELEVEGFGVAVLRTLDQKHHQKGDNTCPSINH